MSGGAWEYLSHRLRDGDVPVSWLPTIFDALADVERLIDWAESLDTSKADAMPQVWARLVTMFDQLTGVEYGRIEWPHRGPDALR